MRKRTQARELALQFLYQIDITKDKADSTLEGFWQEHKVSNSIKEFALQIISGITSNLEEVDKLISKYTQNWQLKRMAVIDRNILRLGCFELLFLDDVPPKVSINEAIELAKKYGDLESSKFVNGILDKIHKSEIKK